MNDEKSRIRCPDPHPDPLRIQICLSKVRIQIRTKMSRIRNTEIYPWGCLVGRRWFACFRTTGTFWCARRRETTRNRPYSPSCGAHPSTSSYSSLLKDSSGESFLWFFIVLLFLIRISSTESYGQCGGSGMFIPDPGSDFFPSRIPDPNCLHPGSRILVKEFKYSNPKKSNGF